jgi:hypothetical protein
MKALNLTLIIAGALLLAGCVTGPHMRPGFGDSLQADIAKQVIDPTAGQRVTAKAGTLDGQKAEAAMDRYRKDKGKVETGRIVTDVGSSSSGG